MNNEVTDAFGNNLQLKQAFRKLTLAERRETITPVITPHRIAMHGPCGLYERHEGHVFVDKEIEYDNAGFLLFHDCPGQYSECGNCDDRKCMDCVLRIWHDNCEDSCPMCC